ncbi:unnamed protein product [Linum trigynum]|uniref:Uncharacterized protein n=1 Tax=Linum trigynum TaxID=586398 RepID=A0AAV2CY37_9ROSI
MCSVFPSEIILNACHSDSGEGMILPSIPSLTPPSNLINEAWPDGDEILTGACLTVSQGMMIKTETPSVNQKLQVLDQF